VQRQGGFFLGEQALEQAQLYACLAARESPGQLV